MKAIIPFNLQHLKLIVHECIEEKGPNCDLNFIDVSSLEDLSGVFSYPNHRFNGDISRWNVSHVTNMSHLFFNSLFAGDISRWDVSKVTDMSWMFWRSLFRGDISRWEVSEDANMKLMFYESPLELENRIPGWYVC